MLKYSASKANKSLEPPVSHSGGATQDAERGQKPTVAEPPYEPYAEEPPMPGELPYQPYAKKPALPEPPYEPYKDI
jgi:hypothetical protein